MKKMTSGIDVKTGEIVEREFTEDEYKQAEEDAQNALPIEFSVAPVNPDAE